MLSTAVPQSQAINTLQPVSQLQGVTALATLMESWRTYTSEGGNHKDVQGIATDTDGYFYVVTNDTLTGNSSQGTGFDFWSFVFPMLPPGQFADPVDVLLKVDPTKSRGIRQSIGILSAPVQAPPVVETPERKSIFPPVHSAEPVSETTPSPSGVEVLRGMLDSEPVLAEPTPTPIPKPAPVPSSQGIQSFTQPENASEESPTGFLDDFSTQTVILRNIVSNETFKVTEIPQVAGRSSISSQLPISKDSSVSRRHCQIQLVNGKVVVTDLGSANGTFIGAKRLTPHQPTECPMRGVLRLGAVNLILEEN